MTGCGALSASVALFSVNADYLSFHVLYLLKKGLKISFFLDLVPVIYYVLYNRYVVKTTERRYRMDFSFLAQTPLFRGTEPDEIKKMLDCLGAVRKQYRKDECIYRSGDTIQSMGLILSGGVNIESYEFDGKKVILSHATEGQLFAETYACLQGEPLMVNVTASEPSDILFLNAQRMLQTCQNACAFHTKLIENLLTVTAQKNMNLSRRIFHTSPRTIRGRLESYLSYESKLQRNRDFMIPFDRQQLADYLNVDRSALSHELGKMQSEGLLSSEKNHFRLLK